MEDPHFVALQTALAGRYSLERVLGRGGMGIVYLAHEVALDRPVALKLLPPEMAAQEDVRDRFLLEARTAAKLSHPNIVPIFAVDQVDEFVFFVMALVEGETLGERVRSRGPLSDAEATRLMREVAWALAYAHLQGVVHRDVKPDNILLEVGTGRALVTDFGIAQVSAETEREDTDRVLGTAEFMSPEQAKGASVDGRSDLYSLGVVGFYAVSGRVPFEASTAAAVLGMHLAETPPPVASRAPQLSASLARTIDRCLRKDPDTRFPDGGAIADALAQEAAIDRPLPVPLRVFIKHLREMTKSFSGLAIFALVFLLPSLVEGIVEGSSVVVVALVAALAALFGLGGPGLLAYHARKLLRAGHTVEDARIALEQDVMQRNEEFQFEVGLRTTGVDVLLKWVSLGGFGVAALTAVPLWLSSGASSSLWTIPSLALVTGLGAGALHVSRTRRRADIAGERLLKLLRGRLGDWVFKLGGFRLKGRVALGASTYRPTEMAIGLAADRLYEELPKETRRSLSGLPDTVRGLEADARSLRGQVAELNGVLAELGDDPAAPGQDARAKVRADVTATRDEAASRLREAVKALETIRVGLLRMHAGESVLQSVTMELKAAKEISSDLESLLEGHREVERLLAQRRATGTFTIVDE